MLNEIDRYTVRVSQNKTGPVITGVVIGDTYNPKKRINKYVVQVTFMHGDADGYETEEVGFDIGDEPRMIEFLNFLSRCAAAYPSGKGGYANYTHVPGYSKWVEGYEDDEFEAEDFDEVGEPFEEDVEAILSWPYWEGEYCASFDKVIVVFFDENGAQRQVQLQEETN